MWLNSDSILANLDSISTIPDSTSINFKFHLHNTHILAIFKVISHEGEDRLIIKTRTKPPQIFQLESLLQRMPTVHPRHPHWTEKLRRITAGYHGELRVDSFWHEIDLSLPHYFIHDLFIQKEKSSHQIDSVLVTSRFVLVLEIKSISGLLNFDPTLRQFSRTNKDGSIDGMNNPDDQLRRHEKWLEQFLRKQRIQLPVVGAIIFTYPSSVIQSRAGSRIMIQSSGLPHLMEQLLIRHPHDVLSKKKTEVLAKNLLALYSIKPFASLGLTDSFPPGVLCPNCPYCFLHYRGGKWRCNACLHVDPLAHLDALRQYRSLVKTTISSREFRDFTGIMSPSIASKLLASSKMAYHGSFKDRQYVIPEAF
ncbi:NERD domain-containing protein [Planococcus sp. ANT_H30]|uniref:NERD domain-containing protein n=1 Tax=Planococcus sp. ANT_H30 TaxID=2597347 RepID=UPI0021D2CC74|nr:NERD domain-containing protein [Planococcus sp. ANT_H30]